MIVIHVTLGVLPTNTDPGGEGRSYTGGATLTLLVAIASGDENPDGWTRAYETGSK